jgi:amino acid efflux transporter
MIKSDDLNSKNLSGLVELGLGSDFGAYSYILLLGTVVFGMPSAAIIAGRYCETVFSIEFGGPIVSFLIIIISLGINYLGLKATARFAILLSFVILVVCIAIIKMTTMPIDNYVSVIPSYNVGNIYQGAVLSFWAFAGFENLAFLYDKFKRPKRDLLLTVFSSILICGTLYICLVANFAALVPLNSINHSVGLIQLVGSLESESLSYSIAFFAIFTVLINFITWGEGISSLILKGIEDKVISYRVMNLMKVQKSHLIQLYTLLVFNTCVLLIFPSLFDKVLVVVSTNFLIVYSMLIMSYFLYTKHIWRKLFSLAVLFVLLITLSSSGVLLLYPVFLFIFTLSYKLKKNYE